jgi:tRNA modification GTPase
LGLHLTRPWRVVVAGRPNAGKSSLVNALLAYSRSIVFDQPGTTRDLVTALTSYDGWPIELCDTAGLRETLEPLEAAGIDRARLTLANADLAIVLIDVSVAPTEEDQNMLVSLPRAIAVAHKCDLPTYGDNTILDNCKTSPLAVSSKTGEGVQTLWRTITDRLVPEVPALGTPLPVTPRQVALLERAHEALVQGDRPEASAAIREILG